jgi:hypothetical protein
MARYLTPLFKIIIEEVGKKKNESLPHAEIAQNIINENRQNLEITNTKYDSIRRYVQDVRANYSYYLSRLKVENAEKAEIRNPKIQIQKHIKEKNFNEEIGELKKYNTTLLNEIELKDRKLGFYEELKQAPKKSIIITPSKGVDSEATAFLVGSDWHLEEKVDPLTVNGLNEFNPPIAKDSIMNFFSNGLRLVQICQKDVHINEIMLLLIGDIINGYIHEEFVEDNYLSPTQASLMGLDLICSGITYLLKNSKCKIKVVCKYGNHGRTTGKPRIATAYKNSFEWMLFQLVIREFARSDRVEVVLDNSYLTYVEVYNRVIRLHHGDAIQYNGGVGGVTIPANKAIAQWDKHKQAYLDVFGHFHQLQLDTGSYKYVLNGSVVGYNPYAISIKAAYEEPRQAFFLIDSKRGKTVSAPIFVRKKITQ